MTDTLVDLPNEVTRSVAGRLQARLADAIVLHDHAKQAHWNVKGPAFIALHELFDRLAAQAAAQADELAERIVALGHRADGTTRIAAGMTTLPDWPEGILSGKAHLRVLVASLRMHADALREDARRIDDLGDMASADLLVGQLREAEKMLWMLAAHLEADA